MSDTLLTDLHVKYIQNLGKVSGTFQEELRFLTQCACGVGQQNKDDLTYHMTAHLRMNAVYWGVTALCIMKHKDALDAEETIEYVMSCWDDEAGPSSPCCATIK
jgi:geranylgeranyl transferase type-2 subunit beta